MFSPPVKEPPQLPPIGRREIAMEELHRVQLYQINKGQRHMFSPPVKEPPQLPPIGRREIATEELHRVQLYTTELRALLSHPRLPAASWPQIAAGLVDRVATTVDAARSALRTPSAMQPSGGEGSCTAKDGSDGESGKRSRERSFKISRTNQPYYDGHEWRKYGQKKISGCKFDREYYRCAYKEQGCLAQKQVQQHSDGDSPLYIVKSKFEHTCKSLRDAAGHSGLFPGQGIQWFSPGNPASSGSKERPKKCAKLEEGTSPPAVATGLGKSVEYSSTDGLGGFGHLGFAWDQMLEVAPRSRFSNDEDFFSPELLAELEAIFHDDAGK